MSIVSSKSSGIIEAIVHFSNRSIMNKIGIAMASVMAIFTGCDSGSSMNEDLEIHPEEANQITLFTTDTEFFIEHSDLVHGAATEILVHVTNLDTYKPYLTGNLTVQIGELSVQSKGPDRPGIYIISLTPAEEGDFEIIYTLQSGEIRSVVSYPVEIHHASEEEEGAHMYEETVAHMDEEEGLEEPGEVNFLKEMAWNNDFMVQQVLPQPFSSVLRASGEILAVPGEKKNVAANSSGMVVFADRNLVQGSRVERDQHLFTITANTVGSDNFELLYQEYLNKLNQSRSEYRRHQTLFQSGVIPERQYMESRTAYISDSIRFYDLAGKAGEDGLMVVAPAEGFIHYLNVAEGQYVEAGQLLVTISSDRTLLLRADIPQQHYSQLKQVVTANFRPAFTDRIYGVDELNGKLLARGSSVAENDHYIPLYFEVQNDGSLLEGAYAEFYLIAGQEENRLLVPETAIFEEQGNHFVYTQMSGESYSKRSVIPGESNGIMVEIVEGLLAGDRVVTRGAMLLKSASMVIGDGGHGHSH